MLATDRNFPLVQSLGGQPEAGTTEKNATLPLAEDRQIPQFDPEKHLNYIPPKARYSFTELGLEKPHNAPDLCYTEPFQLLSEEGVRVMRRELFRKEFLDRYMRVWARAPCYIGGHTADEGVRTVLSCALRKVSMTLTYLCLGGQLHQAGVVSPGDTSGHQ